MVSLRLIAARLALAAPALLAACDIPTSAPKYTTAWNVPVKSTTISVNSLLPSGVTATNDNSAFQISVSPATTTISRSLGQDCAACATANGQTIPKPAFTGGGTSTVTVPSTLGSASLVRDTVTVTINNGYSFDPIRPSASARGYLVIRIVSGATTVGRDSIDGAALALAPGSITTRKIPLSGTITGANGLQVSTSLSSPVGDPVVINTAQSISVTGALGAVFVSSATVNLTGQQVTGVNTTLNLGGIDSSITDHVSGASLLLTVTNPFAATGTLNVSFTGGTQPVVKQIVLGTGTTTPVVTLTQSEVQALFGHDITLTFSGTVNGSNVTVAPGQTVVVAARLQLDVNVGGSN